MTEYSYFWDQNSVGDSQSSWTDDEFALFMQMMFNYDRTKAAVTNMSGFLSSGAHAAGTIINAFDVANWTIREDTAAIVDGRVWMTDADLDLAPASGDGYYAIILRRSIGGASDQTVRAALLYNAGAAPTPTQTAAVWECVLAQCHVTGGQCYIDNLEYVPIPQHLFLPFRSGSSATNWHKASSFYTEVDDSTVFPINQAIVQVGVVTNSPVAGGSKTVKVVFPERFRRSCSPLVFITPVNLSGGTPSHAAVIRVTFIQDTEFNFMIDDDTGIEYYNWLAVGPEENNTAYY